MSAPPVKTFFYICTCFHLIHFDKNEYIWGMKNVRFWRNVTFVHEIFYIYIDLKMIYNIKSPWKSGNMIILSKPLKKMTPFKIRRKSEFVTIRAFERPTKNEKYSYFHIINKTDTAIKVVIKWFLHSFRTPDHPKTWRQSHTKTQPKHCPELSWMHYFCIQIWTFWN